MRSSATANVPLDEKGVVLAGVRRCDASRRSRKLALAAMIGGTEEKEDWSLER